MTLNVDRLMQRHPILVAGVDSTDSGRPRWVLNNNNPPFPLAPHPIIKDEIYPVQDVAEVAKAEDAGAQAFNLAQGPLWRVAVYKLDRELSNTYYVALTVHHVVTDSMGALNLFKEILRQPPGFPATRTEPPIPNRSLPPRAEKTLTLHPSLSMAIKRGTRWALNHPLSWIVTNSIGAQIKWPPPSRMKTPPGESDIGYISLDLRRDHERVAERLEALGDGIGSVHSILHTAAVIALAAAAHDDVFDTLSTETPKSLRLGGHPRIGGNYTGLIEKFIPRPKLRAHTVASFTKKFNDYLHSSRAEYDARCNIGEFRLVPDRFKPDLWRSYLAETAKSGDPYRHSLSISNLGRFDPEDMFRLENVWYGHSSAPWGAAINMNVVSLSPPQALDVRGRRDFSRLTVMISWNTGIIESDIIDRFCPMLQEIIQMFAHAGGMTHTERMMIRSRELWNIICWARQKLPPFGPRV